ncbi:MAG TPA: ABC transporter transmembrane domain-containing protein [Anaerolineales bacterium]|nr:ABC transporter transmembrane domain-containing protein [Anaerolineales bacterium]
MFRNPSPPPSNEPFVRPSAEQITRLLSYLKPYRRWLFVAVLSLLFGAAMGLVFPWIMQTLVDAVLAGRDVAQLNTITAVLVVTFLVRSVFYYFQGYSLTYVGERVLLDLRKQTYAHLHRLSVRFFADRRTGELLSRLSSDVSLVRGALTGNLVTALGQLFTFVGSLVLMLILNWRLSLFILAITPIIVLSAAIFGRYLRRLTTEIQDKVADSTAMAEEAIAAIRVVKAFVREPFEVDRYGKQLETTFGQMMRQSVLRSAFGPLMSFLGFSTLAAVLWFGGQEVIEGRLTAGSLIAFLVYGINIAASLGTFTGLYTQLQEAAGASRRIFELLDEVPEIRDGSHAKPLPPVSGSITFDCVSFAYSDAGAVLHDIDLTIQPGEALALVGPSGAGKSTVFNLIPRFYDATSGQVCIDGHDLREVTLESLRMQIGIVAQEVQLFAGTVRENLRYGKLDATDAELEAAARAANAEEFIVRLAHGYDTVVGERGVKLSGGQRQRIAIARAILKNPRILLLDEATSSLDSESEGLVQEALERLMKDRTTVIIAHRLSTVHNANRIAVLDQGRLMELGDHPALMARGGLYARLYNMQFQNNHYNEKDGR